MIPYLWVSLTWLAFSIFFVVNSKGIWVKRLWLSIAAIFFLIGSLEIYAGTILHNIDRSKLRGDELNSYSEYNDLLGELSGGHGANVVIECVGNTDALQSSLEMSRPGGTISITGLFWEPFPLNMTDFFHRNLTLTGGVAPSRCYIPVLLPHVEDGQTRSYSCDLTQASSG